MSSVYPTLRTKLRFRFAAFISAWLHLGCAAATCSDFEQLVRPIFQEHCVRCHNKTTQKGELDLSSLPAVLEGSESGEIVTPGSPNQSRLWEVIRDEEMPPTDEGAPLSEVQKAVVKNWLQQWRPSQTAAASDATRRLDQHDVLPILLQKCAECHGRNLSEGGLDVRALSTLLEGGKNGPALVPGNADKSLLIQRIRAHEMPPLSKLAKYSVKPVSTSELRKLETWIDQGANWSEETIDRQTSEPDPLVTDADRRHWAFQPPVKKLTPPVSAMDCRRPLDQFIAAALHDANLTFAPLADRATLIRRLSYDLRGLPPSPHEVETFMNDHRPDAYQHLVDRLLASPNYGERWGQYWLDLAGYADSEGVQHADPIRPHAYRYRDYVIRAFNEDKSYRRFLHEQIAGDELEDYEGAEEITEVLYDNLVATGFLRMTSDGTFAGITGFLPNRLDVIDDQLRVLSSAVMGITLRCARCHTHKFDPLPQRDYYRMAAIFKGATDEFDWLRPLANPSAGQARYLPHVTSKESEHWQRELKRINTIVDDLVSEKASLEKEGDANQAERDEIQKRISNLEKQRPPQPMIRALWDRGDPSPTYLLRRGDYRQPGRVVGPGVPSMLTDGATAFETKPPWPGAKKTGNRLALARWLTQPNHPLTARVIVNRIWKHHFGQGLHEPLDDFGRATTRPVHHELLDFLAVSLVENDFSLKWLHREIVRSRTYLQSSMVSETRLQRDPENKLFSRMPMRRLDAEALRDSLIFVAGQLDGRQFGPAAPVSAREDGLVSSVAVEGGYRRSIYTQKRRTKRLTILENFDRPRMSPNCVARTASNVAPQALHLMNNKMIFELSEALANRIEREVGSDGQRQVSRLFQLTIGRMPQKEERVAMLESVKALRRSSTETDKLQSLTSLCHAMFNSAAFLYVD